MQERRVAHSNPAATPTDTSEEPIFAAPDWLDRAGIRMLIGWLVRALPGKLLNILKSDAKGDVTWSLLSDWESHLDDPVSADRFVANSGLDSDPQRLAAFAKDLVNRALERWGQLQQLPQVLVHGPEAARLVNELRSLIAKPTQSSYIAQLARRTA
jgi:hypothetical protein